jgi:hypothetical protein
MTIFDYIASILFNKKQNCLNSVDEESSFSPYIVNRWLSMYSPDLAIYSNIINKYLGVFENKRELYSLFVAVFPKVPSKRITYIKKKKKEKEEEDITLKQAALNLEMSQREILQLVESREALLQ